jgi:putative transposase
MPRKPRMYLPGLPYHVIQRGNNRGATFFSNQDYQFYLDCLQDASERYGVFVHAYVLMTNHVHLLVTPVNRDSISRAIQSVGRRYVQFVNFKHRRTGTLWEGRHRMSLVDSEKYLLTCMRYIELNPVRANLVQAPADYRWSSYRFNAYSDSNPVIKRHEIYEALGFDAEERMEVYRSLFDDALKDRDIEMIRRSAMSSMPTGSKRFREQVEKATGRKLGHLQRGRPFAGRTR